MKNIHKYPLLTLVVAAVGWLQGCDNGEKYLRIEPASIEIASDVLETSSTVESSSASWMAYCSAGWVEYDYDGNTLFVTITGTNESPTDRSAEITIVTGDGQSRVIPLVQRAKNAVFKITPATLEPFDNNAPAPQTVAVETNLSDGWNFTKLHDSPWLTVVRGEGNDAGTLTVSVERSRELDPKIDSLIIAPVNELFLPLADTVRVVQEGNMLIITSGLLNTGTYILEVPAEGIREGIVSVFAMDDWTVEVAGDTGGRVSFDPAGGVSEIEYGIPLNITVPENLSGEPYTCTLIFSCGGEQYEYGVVQAGITAN